MVGRSDFALDIDAAAGKGVKHMEAHGRLKRIELDNMKIGNACRHPSGGFQLVMGVPPEWMVYNRKSPLKWMVSGHPPLEHWDTVGQFALLASKLICFALG